ncbi:hypothetical protein D9M70_511340 [compost metagenome]
MIVIGFLVIALDHLELPAGLRLRLGEDEAFGQLDLHFRRRLAVAAVWHLQHRLEGALHRRRVVFEGGVRVGNAACGKAKAERKRSQSGRVHVVIS